MRITEHYEISGTVPFLDVDVHDDNRLFVDPRAIRLSARRRDSFADSAVECMDSFTGVVFHLVTTENAPAGLRLLKNFREPWETRLGMSQTGFHGHGGAEDIGARIWDALTADLEALVRVGVLQHLEDLALFVDGIDRDISSDITTRVVFGPLADFTAEVLRQYPQFTAGRHRTGVVDRQVWNPTTENWSSREMELPLVDGRPLVLVPRDWPRASLLMSARRYYETAVLDQVQLDHLVATAQGEILKTPKAVLKQDRRYRPSRETNRRVTVRAHDERRDLLRQFRAFVDARYERYSDDELDKRIA